MGYDISRPAPARRAVILTALPVECREVLAHLTDVHDVEHPSGTVYWQGRFVAEAGDWDVLVAEIGAHNDSAAVEAERAISYFHPAVALFVGVAGGLKDVRLGDVIFADKVYGYEAGKDGEEFHPRPEVNKSSHALVQRGRAEATRGNWRNRILNSPGQERPQALPGPIAAGAKVVADTRSATYRFLRKQYGDALAVEMEGKGFLTATSANQHVYSLVVRGISDCIDAKAEADASGSQELASRHASAFAFEVLARFTLRPLGGITLQRNEQEPQGAVWTVPYPRNPNFTGRDALLQALREHFLSPTAIPKPQALFGLGGIGKTQLAVEYASRHSIDQASYSHVLWLRAGDPSVLASDYAALADSLSLPEKVEVEQQRKLDAVRAWLQGNEGWLLIFDNAEKPEDLVRYLPPVLRGHVLITTLNPAWSALATPREVDVLERADSITLLRQRTRQENEPELAALAVALGDLPLALVQAAAYIEQTGKSIQGYLQLFEKRRSELLAKYGAPADHQTTVTATWELSFEQVSVQSPAGAELLSLCAFLAPSLIPVPMLQAGAELLPASLAAVLADELRLDDAISVLRRYSLVQAADETLLFHQLVQAVMGDRLAEGGRPWAESALRLIHQFFQFDSHVLETWSRCAFLLPHALTIVEHARRFGLAMEALPELLGHIGSFWNEQGDYQRAYEILLQALGLSRVHSGPTSTTTAALLRLVGEVEWRLGMLQQAQEHLEVALTLIRARPAASGVKLSEATALGTLSLVFQSLGQWATALDYAEKAYTMQEAHQEGDEPRSGSLAGNLGSILVHLARFEEGQKYLEIALRTAERQFGTNHPQVAGHLNSLGNLLEELGRYKEAQQHYERALEITEAHYGPSHPHVAAIVRNLAGAHLRQEKLQQAEELCMRALRINEASFGPEHDRIASDLNDLARVFHAQKRLKMARECFERAISIWEKDHARDHANLATTLDNLGRVQEEQRDFEAARTSFQRALSLHEKILGPDHPKVANVLNNLGLLLGRSLGELPQARRHLERALEIDEKAYGRNHPEVAMETLNLAGIVMEQGEYDLALTLLLRAMAICDSETPPAPHTARLIRFTLGKLHVQRHEWGQARLVLERAFHFEEREDPEGSQFVELQILLGIALNESGEYAQAIACFDRALASAHYVFTDAVLIRLLSHLRNSLIQLRQTEGLRTRFESLARRTKEAGHQESLLFVSLGLARIYKETSKLKEALAHLDIALEALKATQQPMSVEVQLQRQKGEIYVEQERWQAARDSFERVLALLDKAPEALAPKSLLFVHQYLGIALFRLNNPKRAQHHVDKALALAAKQHGTEHPQYATTLLVIAAIQEQAGQRRHALKGYKRALSIFQKTGDAPPASLEALELKIRKLSS